MSAPANPPYSVLKWTEGDVAAWLRTQLRAAGVPGPLVGQAERRFVERGIHGPLLLALDESDLQVDLGLEDNIARKRVLVELAGLRERVHRERLAEAAREQEVEDQKLSQQQQQQQATQGRQQVFPSQHLAPLAARASCKLINDPIHGHILLEPELVQIIDTPQFQRLRDLKQLGTSYYVFPGASHNRFEHSIGTAHLAGLLLQFLRHHQPELRITSREILLVKIAGLCHDLGHGPFSHAFDNEFIPMARPEENWSHEDASIMMLDDILRSQPGIGLSPREARFVKELINPSQFEPETFPDRGFLYDVVANYRNSMDVDKFDYISRDTFKLGMKSNFDHLRLMHHARVINNQICFHSKEVTNVYTLFQQRFLLHRSVYSHKVAKAVEYMVTDTLLAADPVLKISDAIRDPKRYVKLSDALLLRIEHDDDPRLAPAQAIIRRLRRRDLYKLVTEALLPTNVDPRLRDVHPEDICHALREADPELGRVLQADDLRIHNLALNYARQDKNPVERVRFFTDWTSTTSVLIPEHKVSFMLPQQFQERWLRVYLKHPTPEKIAAAREATRAFFEKYDCFSPGVTGLPYSLSQEAAGRSIRASQQLAGHHAMGGGLESLIEDSADEDLDNVHHDDDGVLRFGFHGNSHNNNNNAHFNSNNTANGNTGVNKPFFYQNNDDSLFGTPSKPERPSAVSSADSAAPAANFGSLQQRIQEYNERQQQEKQQQQDKEQEQKDQQASSSSQSAGSSSSSSSASSASSSQPQKPSSQPASHKPQLKQHSMLGSFTAANLGVPGSYTKTGGLARSNSGSAQLASSPGRKKPPQQQQLQLVQSQQPKQPHQQQPPSPLSSSASSASNPVFASPQQRRPRSPASISPCPTPKLGLGMGAAATGLTGKRRRSPPPPLGDDRQPGVDAQNGHEGADGVQDGDDHRESEQDAQQDADPRAPKRRTVSFQ